MTKDKAKRRLIVLNDRARYNQRYRAPIMDRYDEMGWSVVSLGTLERPFRAFWLILAAALDRRACIVASNLRSNLLFLLMPWARGVVILNGLGRYRGSWRFRWLLLRLVARRRRVRLLVQSYADYRYLRRFGRVAHMRHLPGSGGRAKATGPAGKAVLVQRDDKLPLVAASVRRLMRALDAPPFLTVVGCHDEAAARRQLDGVALTSAGYVAAESIFAGGGIFVQPTGYGEGFPHTLADAIASGMRIWIADIELLRYGLARLGARARPISDGWSEVEMAPELEEATSEAEILKEIEKAVSRLIGCREDSSCSA